MPIMRKDTPGRTQKNKADKPNKSARNIKSRQNITKRRPRKIRKERKIRKAPKMHDDPRQNGPVVIGLIYANWCGHCQQLKPTWEELKKRIMNDYDNKFTIVEIEADQADKSEQLAKLEQHLNGEKIQAGGYPTMFKLADGKANYYGGARDLDSMMNWATGNKQLVGGYRRDPQISKSKSKRKSKRKRHTPIASK